ncbi:MAG: nicotinate-nucleotide--dimethylbenzimidazole phosphoribosyltransferase [Nitrospinae bacterium]|nr:nicotinate-nucleotide--dimethylbenzimidazole phosphoribosyltransferase [Nitrospinota bacterium]
MHDTLNQIEAVSVARLESAQAHLDSLTKPPGSLGRLEELGRRYAAIKGIRSPKVGKKAVFVFAADHGVTEEGVSAYPREVTRQMALNFLDGGAAINVLARHAGAEVVVVDMGIDHDFGSCPGLLDRKIAMGTRNMAKGPAMTREQAERALQAGIDLAREWAGRGYDILGTGDMGIGNTTASSAIMAVFGGQDARRTAGRGTGVNDETFQRKISAIEQAIRVNRPNPQDPVDVLAKVGGFEIAGIAGFILGAAASKTPVVIDGLISSAGAVVALKLKETARDYIFTSHRSTEPGQEVFFQLLGHPPLFDFGMRLGEGSGAALAIPILEAGVKIYSEMATFQSAGVSQRNTPP